MGGPLAAFACGICSEVAQPGLTVLVSDIDLGLTGSVPGRAACGALGMKC